MKLGLFLTDEKLLAVALLKELSGMTWVVQ